MRAGTQTLIQALHALPLVDDPEIDDELMNHDSSLAESDSDDDGKHHSKFLVHCGILREFLYPSATTLASSIHTIYRPVARSRRQESLHTLLAVDDTSEDPADLASGQEQLQRSMISDEDTDADDFELPNSITTSHRAGRKDRPIGLSPVLEHGFPKSDLRRHAERSGSMSTVKTVKLSRRARLAEKLAEVFDIGGINEVIAGRSYAVSVH